MDSPLVKSLQEYSVEVGMSSKGRLSELTIHVLQIAKSSFSRIVENPQRTDYSSSLNSRCLTTFWFIDEDRIGIKLLR